MISMPLMYVVHAHYPYLLPILQVQDNELAIVPDLTMPAANRPPGDSKAS